MGYAASLSDCQKGDISSPEMSQAGPAMAGLPVVALFVAMELEGHHIQVHAVFPLFGEEPTNMAVSRLGGPAITISHSITLPADQYLATVLAQIFASSSWLSL